MDDTGCFVLGRPYGRRGVLSLFEGGGGVPKVFSRKDPVTSKNAKKQLTILGYKYKAQPRDGVH